MLDKKREINFIVELGILPAHKHAMRTIKNCQLFLFFLLFVSTTVFAQDNYLPLSREYGTRYESFLNRIDSDMHTSIKPYSSNEVKAYSPFDSLNQSLVKDSKFTRTLVGRKLLKEHLFVVDKEDFKLNIDPAFDFQVGNESEKSVNTYTNTRGYYVTGSIGKQVSFQSSFYENQAVFPGFIKNYVSSTGVVPGQGKTKTFNTSYDYAMATGSVVYTPSKHFTFQFGNDKNFIGDGYRSLLLSDNSFSYPFLKVTTTVWKLKYMNLFTAFQDLTGGGTPDVGFKRKYGSFHYLDLNIGKHVSVGFFEAIIWRGDTLNRGYDIHYLNPVIFLRPVEFSVGSPDNVMMGLNVKAKIFSGHVVYGQLMLDEFKIDEVRSGKGWWANKQAFQLGYKGFNIGIPNLGFQTEFNFVRPYTYQHRTTLQNYAHYNQALAHPLGANFSESVSILDYRFKDILFSAKLQIARIGLDTAGINYGQDIFRDYLDFPNLYGNNMYQGLDSDLFSADLRIGYMINPNYNMRIEAGLMVRELSNSMFVSKTNWIMFGIKTGLVNKYYDF